MNVQKKKVARKGPTSPQLEKNERLKKQRLMQMEADLRGEDRYADPNMYAVVKVKVKADN